MARKAKPAKTTAASNDLLSAVQFVGSVLKDVGSIPETHIFLTPDYIASFNGVVASGIKYPHTIDAIPNYILFEKALARCENGYSIEKTSDTLVIKSGKFKAIVPCVDPLLLPIGHIDDSIIKIDNEFKKGVEAVLPLASENGQTIYDISILINGKSVIGCLNGVVMLEYWHGNELPTNIAIPKSLAVALTKSTKNLTGFGHSDTTVTFYFEDGSWIRSQLFKEQWPDIGRILNVSANTFEIPKDFYEGLVAITPYSTDGLCYCDSNYVRSSNNENIGASFEVKGLPRGPIFNIKQLMLVKNHVKQIDFFCEGGKMVYFQGDKVRGVIAGRTI